MEFYILFSFCFLWCLSLTIKNIKRKNENILLAKEYKQLSGNYDKLCDVLAGEINVEDVKNKLEGKVEQKALVEKTDDNVNLTASQIKILREEGSKKERSLFFNWSNIKDATLPYSLLTFRSKQYSTKSLYLFINDQNIWEIIDHDGLNTLRLWKSSFNKDSEISVVLDPLQVQEILKNNE